MIILTKMLYLSNICSKLINKKKIIITKMLIKKEKEKEKINKTPINKTINLNKT